MSFPAARWRCQLIGRGRGPRAGLGASLAAAGAQLSGKNWGGCCGEISYRSLGGAAGPRSALTAADPGRARGAGKRGWAVGAGASPPPPLFPHPPRALPVALLSPLAFVPTPRGWAPPPTTPLRPVRPPPPGADRQGIGHRDPGRGQVPRTPPLWALPPARPWSWLEEGQTPCPQEIGGLEPNCLCVT